MSTYPTSPRTLSYLITLSFKQYGAVLKAIFPMILLSAVVKDLYIYFGGLPANSWFRLAIIIVMVLAELYLWAVILWGANAVLLGAPVRLNQACREVYRKLSAIYAGFFALLLVLCVVFFVGYLLSNIFSMLAGNTMLVRSVLTLLLIGLPMTFAFVLFLFVLPLLILESLPIWLAFRRSILWVGYENWLRTFSVYAVVLVVILFTSPTTAHGQWLAKHYLSFLFDAFILSLFGPLVINYLLLLLNDLRLRRSV